MRTFLKLSMCALLLSPAAASAGIFTYTLGGTITGMPSGAPPIFAVGDSYFLTYYVTTDLPDTGSVPSDLTFGTYTNTPPAPGFVILPNGPVTIGAFSSSMTGMWSADAWNGYFPSGSSAIDGFTLNGTGSGGSAGVVWGVSRAAVVIHASSAAHPNFMTSDRLPETALDLDDAQTKFVEFSFDAGPGFSFQFTRGSITSFTVTPVGIVTVPEPSAIALLGLALAGLGFARRRKLH